MNYGNGSIGFTNRTPASGGGGGMAGYNGLSFDAAEDALVLGNDEGDDLAALQNNREIPTGGNNIIISSWSKYDGNLLLRSSTSEIEETKLFVEGEITTMRKVYVLSSIDGETTHYLNGTAESFRVFASVLMADSSDAGAVYFLPPAIIPGLTYTIISGDTNGFVIPETYNTTIFPNGTDKIRFQGGAWSNMTTADEATGITLICTRAGVWNVLGNSEAWHFNP